jgi:hypothetical protein
MAFFTAVITFSSEHDSVGILTGTVVLPDGAPMGGAFVYLFEAASTMTPAGTFRRTPDQIAGQSDRKGHFDVEVPAGEYYLSIIRRKSGKIWGAVQPGDRLYIHRDEKMTRRTISIHAGATLDLGALVGAVITEETKQDRFGIQEIAVIYGTLHDRQQQPVAGATVLAYGEPNRVGQPLFASGPSKADGSYSLKFYHEGTYYLVARTGYPGNESRFLQTTETVLMGKYGGPTTHAPLLINPDLVKTGIDITLYPLATGLVP